MRIGKVIGDKLSTEPGSAPGGRTLGSFDVTLEL
jgi:hypothetical protein